MNMPLIETRNLRHVYQAGTADAVMALDGIALTVERGEFVAIVGGNGSGKSTLAKHLNALLLPTEGEVFVDGMNTRDRGALWEIRQRVGMVFQNPDNQLVATVVEEDVAFGPENLGLPPAEIVARVDDALRVVEMAEYRHHHVGSSGPARSHGDDPAAQPRWRDRHSHHARHGRSRAVSPRDRAGGRSRCLGWSAGRGVLASRGVGAVPAGPSAHPRTGPPPATRRPADSGGDSPRGRAGGRPHPPGGGGCGPGEGKRWRSLSAATSPTCI